MKQDCRVVKCTVTVVVPHGHYPDRIIDTEGIELTVLDWFEEDLELPSQDVLRGDA